MKTMHIAALIIAAASFNAFAQEADPTSSCIAGLAADVRLAPVADKVSFTYAGESASATLQRQASEQERAALAVWHGLRRQCFDAGEQYRRKSVDAQSRSVLQSGFMFQQVLLSRLQQGELTYAEFNRRRAEIAEGLAPRI